MKSFRFRYLVIVAFACVALFALWFCRRDSAPPYRVEIGSVWTTDYHITYASDRMLGDSVQVVLRRVDASASMYNDTSVVSRVNRNETSEVDDIFIRLYTTSRAVNASSGGAFDPTVQPLVEAWGFGHKTGTAPSKHTIDSLLAVVGIEKTELRDTRIVKRDRRVQLDFSSIAKGLACDEVGRMLSRNGVRNFLVEIGGEVLASGVNPQGQPWHVSVDLPVADSTASSHAPALVLALDSGAVATSGNYRKWREQDGRRVSHLIDPHTGQATVSTLLSVTVIAADCMTADAWATACMVMGDKRVQTEMEHRTDLGVMTISTDTEGNYVVWSNTRFAECVVQQ